MSITVALRLAYVVLTLSLMAVAAQIGAHLMHARFSPGVTKTLMIAGYLWPLALYAIAVYRRKLKADAARNGSSPRPG